ncbi:SDR family oxidoreductase [Tabrizicola sp.]|uniref:SDR family NAD(P)-dependent oxidoreductase n=1 Tax=Tabrizicola sp. TaxID=2005166 RepID=UPI000BCBB607|nr:SDR family oxidoreductase [Tabrizicola sp.]MBY0352409.1 SDR family oxidoreductase [Tabrizicola sp.]OYX20286.1 MAG: 3-oxoacyl-ACP reductase [Rhodobacterales bacterium 32-66-9]
MAAIYDDLKGKSVFITGGGAGIGAALTEGFLRQGAKVAFCQRSDATPFCDAMERATGNRPLFLPCDISVSDQLHLTLSTAARVHGDITVLVNNAANDQRHETLKTDEAFWDWSMAVNLRSYFFACQSVIPGMQAAGGGSIINFSSISFMMADKGYAAYITANAGIVGLTRTLAREFGPDRIRVNAIAPGWVLTERQKDLWVTPEALAAHLAKQCLPDPIQPEDMAGTVLFLASGASRMMTSQTLVLDGGYVSS